MVADNRTRTIGVLAFSFALVATAALGAGSENGPPNEAGLPTAEFVVGAELVEPAASNGATKARTRRKRRRRPATRFDGYAYVRGYYDDNVFNYSDVDRGSFESANVPLDRFPVDQLDDYVTSLAARGDYLWRIRRYSYWRARVRYDGRYYTRNTDRTYHQVGVELRRKRRRFASEVSIRFTPDFYLRHLYWRPMPSRPTGVRYAAARFSKLSTTLDNRFRLHRKTWGRIVLDHAWRNYDAPFDDRDNNTYGLSAGLEYQPTGRVELSGGTSIALSRAAGAGAASPDVDDVSNNRVGGYLGATFLIGSAHRVRLKESFSYGHQSYTTDNATDTYHYNRSDDEYWLASELTWRAGAVWRPGVFYDYRASTTNVPVGVSDVGQFTGSRFGMKVTYKF